MVDTWQSLNLADLVPGGAQALIDDAATVAGDLSPILEAIATVVDTLALLVIDAADPFAAIVSALITDITTFITDVRNTDVFMLIQNPKLTGMTGFLDDLSESFFDTGDPNRPQFSSGTDVGGVIIVAGAATFSILAPLLDALGDVFGIKEFKRLQRVAGNPLPEPFDGAITAVTPPDIVVDSVQAMTPGIFANQVFEPKSGVDEGKDFLILDNTATSFTLLQDVSNLTVGTVYKIKAGTATSVVPDWKKAGVSELLRPLSSLYNVLSAFSRAIAPAISAAAAVTAYAQILRDKATRLAELADDLDTLLTNIVTLFAGTGFNMLKLPEQTGGVNGFIDRILIAGSEPNFGTQGAVAGVTMFAGPGGFAVLDEIF